MLNGSATGRRGVFFVAHHPGLHLYHIELFLSGTSKKRPSKYAIMSKIIYSLGLILFGLLLGYGAQALVDQRRLSLPISTERLRI